ncbi:MAG: transposase [Planctomycetota bacterium]
MPNYRRALIPSGTYFFTVVTCDRCPIFNNPRSVAILGNVIREAKSRWPFSIDAIVLLKDHWHSIWTLPRNDDQYSRRMAWIKREFTVRWLEKGGVGMGISASKQQQRRKGVWQPRFWEHCINDDDEFDAYFDYIHWNPVKHSVVDRVKDWPYSSFHRWVRQSVYSSDWGCGGIGLKTVKSQESMGEPW